MNSIFSITSYLPMASPIHQLRPNCHLQLSYVCSNQQKFSGGLCSSILSRSASILHYPVRLQSSYRVVTPGNEGTVSVMNFEELMEKDWSFLEFSDKKSEEQHYLKIDQIISAGEIGETSKVLVSIGSEDFVDRLVRCSPSQQLLVAHDSLFTLASIKEKYDNVKCLQGELIYLPEDWVELDVVFLYFLPALPFRFGQILETLAKRCSPGARIVISHPLGRLMVQEQRKQYPDVVVGELPEKIALQDVAAENSFELVKFVDEPDFYLAVLKFKEK